MKRVQGFVGLIALLLTAKIIYRRLAPFWRVKNAPIQRIPGAGDEKFLFAVFLLDVTNEKCFHRQIRDVCGTSGTFRGPEQTYTISTTFLST